MTRSYYDYGWLLDETGTLVGISLGYDRCGEHEQGIAPILAAFGVQPPAMPLGVTDRTVSAVPHTLSFQEYQHKPRDRRRKPYPAAFLILERDGYGCREDAPKGAERIARLSAAQFHGEPGEKWVKPERDDIACAWARNEFCINVRGVQNIARLKELHEAFLRLDIAIALPWSRAFLRGGLSLAIPSRMSDQDKADILARDTEHKLLHEAAAATGIHDVLRAAGKGWHALMPDWFDRQARDEVIFCLNPREQRRYNHGWFTVEELRQWAEDRGPVVMHRPEELRAFEQRPENYNWACRLLTGMEKQGVKLRYGAQLTWADAAYTVPGLRLRMARDCRHVLPDGVYPFEEVMRTYADGLIEQV